MKGKKIIKLIEISDKITVLLGIAMIGIGLYMIYPPAMFIVVGAILSFPGMPRKKVK